MIEIVFLITLALIWIIFATFQDLMNREVANWLNFSLIIFALEFRFFYGLFNGAGFGLFYQGLIGLGIFLVLGNVFYYGRMFAGGDAKLLMALGAILPLSENFMINVNYFLSFFALFLITGVIYGFIWSFTMFFRNTKSFMKEFPRQFQKNKKIMLLITLFAIIFLILGFYYTEFFYLAIFTFIFPYLLVYAKTIDECCMIKKLKINRLREGDWLYKDIKVGKKTIKATWDGLSKRNIELIKKKKIKYIQIRQGIPFVPVFLISFLIFSYGILFGSQSFSFFSAFFFLVF